MSDADLSSVSNADLAAMLAARQLAAIQPLVEAHTALLAAAKAAQTAMAGIVNTRATKLAANVIGNTNGYLIEVNATIADLTPAPTTPVVQPTVIQSAATAAA